MRSQPNTDVEVTTVEESEQRFRAMGTDCHVIVTGAGPELAEHLWDRVVDLERLWSRFNPDSDVSRLNAGAGGFVTVSFETATLVRRSVQAWMETEGRFDPTVLGALVRAGYDRDFDLVAAHPADGHSDLTSGCREIVIRGRQVRLPPGTGFDSGGMGKGLAADLVAMLALRLGAKGVCVNVGGDLRVTGPGPGGGTWTVDVDVPGRGETLARVGLARGGMATSTTLLRRWSVDGQTRHHLIDPGTGRPAASGVVLATVVAGEAWRAEALTKAVLLHAGDDPLAALGPAGADGVAVMSDGTVHGTPGVRSFLGQAHLPAHVS